MSPREISWKDLHLISNQTEHRGPGSVRRQIVAHLCTCKSILIFSVLSRDFFTLDGMLSSGITAGAKFTEQQGTERPFAEEGPALILMGLP